MLIEGGALKRDVHLRLLPQVPETSWRPPTSLPDLSDAAALSFDLETYDPELTTAGPGWARGRGHIIGFSVGAVSHRGERWRAYVPIRHQVEASDNLPPEPALAWLRQTLQTPIPKCGANLMYDVGWCKQEGIDVQGPLHDVQFAEALIDGDAMVALDTLAHKYLGERKVTDALYQWIRDAYKPKKGAERGELYRTPPRLVGPYGEADADLPLRIMDAQYPWLMNERLWPVYRLECDLIPMLVAMRFAGVSVDVKKAVKLSHTLQGDIKEMYAAFNYKYGCKVSNSTSHMGAVVAAQGIKVPRTAADNYSLQAEWLKALEHPIGEEIVALRQAEKVVGTFLKSYIIDKQVGGKLYPQFHPLKGDSNGAKTGRFASADPNLQNIPIRTEIGKKVRTAFIKDEGHLCWEKCDYSQIEYRMLAHYAVDGEIKGADLPRILDFWAGLIGDEWGGDGHADKLRATYRNDASTDYHDVVQNNVKALTGILIERRPIKNINFGLLYGQSEKGLAFKAGFTKEQSKDVFTAYHKGAPYVKPTMEAVNLEVHGTGHIRTITNRRVMFNEWEPLEWGAGLPLPYDQALREYGSNIRRAGAYKGVNYKLQGSGTGDVIKVAMLAAWRSGVFAYTGVPRLQVHDELDFSVPNDDPATREAYVYMRRLLETAMPCRVPIRVDSKRGETWGHID